MLRACGWLGFRAVMSGNAPSSRIRFRDVVLVTSVAGFLVVLAVGLHLARPTGGVGTARTPEAVRATGECASCHRQETGAIVAQFEKSAHSRAGVTCRDCHQVLPGQPGEIHHGFEISDAATSLACQGCHADEYRQFARSRHALPAYAAVMGTEGYPDAFPAALVAEAEALHPGAVERPPNQLARLEGPETIAAGCLGCHDIGAPNPDGSIGSCTACHSRHSTQVALARAPATCGQCHMGPDHAQKEIYSESKHGILFEAQGHTMNLDADPARLTSFDMPIPTCATCHLSGLDGAAVTHDTTERLSWWLFAPVSEKRPHYAAAQAEMQGICLKCHSLGHVERFYAEAEAVVEATNERVAGLMARMEELEASGALSEAPFDETLDFLFFDAWHYAGRTVKHGAFMDGADFVQWHGTYDLMSRLAEIEERAAGLGVR